MSDIEITSRDSGGPLFATAREVIGITALGDFISGRGYGVSGRISAPATVFRQPPRTLLKRS